MTHSEYIHLLHALAEVIKPFAARKFQILSFASPIMTITRTDDGWTYKTSYPEDVQRSLQAIDAMCEQAVGTYIRGKGLGAEIRTATDQRESAPRNERFAFRGAPDSVMPTQGGEIPLCPAPGDTESPGPSQCLYGFVYGK